MKEELATVVESLSAPAKNVLGLLTPEENREEWARWQEGLTRRITLPLDLPRLRMLLVLDNLAGHLTPSLVLWLFARGIMPLYTPLGGSWLNMAESIQRILKRRALEGHHPQTPEQITDWLEAAARGWNADPTPFEWGGRRAARRRRSRARRHAQGGSYGFTRRPMRRSRTALDQWQRAMQTTHYCTVTHDSGIFRFFRFAYKPYKKPCAKNTAFASPTRSVTNSKSSFAPGRPRPAHRPRTRSLES